MVKEFYIAGNEETDKWFSLVEGCERPGPFKNVIMVDSWENLKIYLDDEIRWMMNTNEDKYLLIAEEFRTFEIYSVKLNIEEIPDAIS